MTPQIKQRIEQIRRGEVPEGYKRTKVGIVPEEWKIKRLAQVLRKQTCKNTDNAIHNVLTNSATLGIVGQKDYFDKQIANSENTDNYYIVENGYFVYNPRISVSAHCGPFNKYYGCEKGIMSPLYTVYKYIDCSTDYTEYLSYFFSSANWHRYMNSIANYGARNDRMNVTSDTMSAMPLPYPPLFEQKKITEILQTQDKLIELQQKKIEELKKLKKAYLSKMFPKKGCNVPEIRFPGFTDPWEQRKLGDIADIVGGGTPSTGNQSYWDGDIDWYAPAEIADQIYANSSQKKITGLGYENSSAKMLPPGTVLFTSRAGIGKTAILTRKGCTNQGFQSIVPHRGELDSYFIFSRTEELKRYGELVGAGSTFVEVSGKQMAVMELMMPPTMREQQTIGDFFQQLDHLITLHQRKLEEMKIYKKSLMQLLLTGIVRM